DSSRTWQVERRAFDALLIENAIEKGVDLRFGVRAAGLIREEGRVAGVRARQGDAEFELRAPLTIDASGRDTFAQRENAWRVPDPLLAKVAIWTYFEGAKRDEGLDGGATTGAYLEDKGWIWYIPLPERVSVGVVAEASYLYRDGKDLEAIHARECRLQPWIAD